jgi:hypothetical protein
MAWQWNSIGCPMGPASEYEAELRYALYQAANVAAARVDLFRTYFTKLLRGRERERGIKTKMHVKLVPPRGTGDRLDFNEKTGSI